MAESTTETKFATEAQRHGVLSESTMWNLEPGIFVSPCAFDLRHVSDERLALFFRGVANERPVYLEYFRARGIDLRREPFEIEVSELQVQNGGSTGLVADRDGRASVPGLFAAGDAQGGVGGGGAIGATIALVFGWRAGAAAAAAAQERPSPSPLPEEVACAFQRVARPLAVESGLSPAALETKLGQVMAEYVGMSRTERGLRAALRRLEALAGATTELAAATPHELMKALEVQNLVVVSDLMARAALERTESRWWHRRADFPERDDARWRAHLIVAHEGDRVRLATRPIGSLARGVV
ncbi:MAG: hypothetical protein HY690_17925 [Chloroflexi bacterium]|nr:hypothetical protein [Chloroflexota bacterium]